MQCPHCHKPVTLVTNSRPTRENSQIWRRRKCWHCQALFTTHEIPDLSHLVVIKKSRPPEMYSHMKLYTGIHKATVSKTKNRLAKIDRAVSETERDILFLKKKRVASEEIGNLALKRLRRIDIGMFLRFLSYFKDIETEGQMKKELEKYLSS
jgi:transcriptional repressor NrdR